MASAAEILAAFRELSNAKQLERAELYGLLQDGILAALAKKYGPTVQAEVDIDEGKGDIRIVLLRTVVDVVEDPAREITSGGAPPGEPAPHPPAPSMTASRSATCSRSRSISPSSAAPPCRPPSSASSSAFAKASAPRFATSSRPRSASCCQAKSSRSSAASSS